MSYKRKSKYTKEKMQEAVNNAVSYADVIRWFGLKFTGGNYQMMQQRIKCYEIDTTHFGTGKFGRGWSKGLTAETSDKVRRNSEANRYSDEDILCRNSPESKGPKLRRLMVKHGKLYVCENGHLPKWMEKELTLHVDHIDGDRSNNTLDNLRFLCPNCHQQTDTWGNTGGARRGSRTPTH